MNNKIFIFIIIFLYLKNKINEASYLKKSSWLYLCTYLIKRQGFEKYFQGLILQLICYKVRNRYHAIRKLNGNGKIYNKNKLINYKYHAENVWEAIYFTVYEMFTVPQRQIMYRRMWCHWVNKAEKQKFPPYR